LPWRPQFGYINRTMARRLRKRLLTWLLPAVLVFAQHGAIAHLVSHGSDKSADPEQTQVHVKLCDKCLSAAKFINLLPQQACHIESAPAQYCLAPVVPQPSVSATAATPTCRDPPKTL
jgi:hypothetical protein